MLYFLTEKKQKGAYKNMSQAKVDRYKEEQKTDHQEREKKPCAGTYVRCSHCSSDRMLDRIFRIFLLSGEKADDKDRTQYDSSERIYEQSVQYRQCHRVTVRKSNQKAEGYYNKDRTPIGSVMLCRWGFCVCRKM